MAFFQDLGKKITEGVQDATEKASELMETTKLNSAISKEKDAIDEAKRLMGDKLYTLYKAGDTMAEQFAEDLKNIDTRLLTIAEIEAKIAKIKADDKA